MIRRVVEFPDPFGAGHHVQVVEVITVGCSAGVITTRYHHRVTVMDGHRFIQIRIIRMVLSQIEKDVAFKRSLKDVIQSQSSFSIEVFWDEVFCSSQ